MRVYLLKSIRDNINYEYFVKFTFKDGTVISVPCSTISERDLLNGIVTDNYEGIDILMTKDGIEYPTNLISHSASFESKEVFEDWIKKGLIDKDTLV